jgi:carbon storage regulator
MLILTRTKGERIFINGKEIIITIIDSGKYQVRIGIDAPEHMSIYREEIQDRIDNGDKRGNLIEKEMSDNLNK